MATSINVKSLEAQQWEEDQKRWNELKCPGKEIVPKTIQDINRWISRIVVCMSIVPQSKSQIGVDRFTSGKKISGEFGGLSGGVLMDALGDNNDCLIHSFLTCISPMFQKMVEEARSTIASFFRRFVLPAIPSMDDTMRHRLRSYRFLTGGEISFLSITFSLPIINLQDGDGALTRSMEIFPSANHEFWAGKSDTYTGPFYVIHGNNIHFTPVRYGDKYDISRLRYGELKTIAAKITSEHDAIFAKVSEENAKLEIMKEDFNGRIQPIMTSMKREISKFNNSNQYRKSIEISSMLEILTPLAEEYIDDALISKIIDETIRDKARAAIYKILLDELSKSIPSKTTPNSSSDKMKQLEEFTGQYGLSNDDALAQAIKASLTEPANAATTIKPANAAIKPANVLHVVKKITASIGNNSTQYDVTVYRPISGGKRKTRKSKLVKKQKTKRHIKK